MKAKIIAILILISMFSVCCTNKESENSAKVNFPTQIHLEKKSPDGKINAVIYSWSNSDKENFIGSEYRFIVGFISNKSKWYVDYELSEGFGTYEGGITEIQWLNDHEVLIKRIIGDRPKNIKYNIRSNEWKLNEEKE